MKLISSLLLLLATSFCSAQDFYDLQEIQTIEITFSESNWDQLLDAAYASDLGYILAQSVTINGTQFDSVGVKYKGNSTYNPNQTKNPFHIELDTYKEQDYLGYKDIKLSNGSKDPSMLREVLSYHILRKYMEAPFSNYANVYVNGDLIGLYSNSESITKRFTKSHFDSKGNTFIKCNPPAGAGPQSNDFPNLVYLGEDSTDYYEAYELKTDYGWSELIDLCDTLSSNIDDIEKILDVDKALWMLAFNNVLVNLDSYNGAFAQNYYLYRDDHGRFLPIVWDLNESFGRFSRTGTSNLNNTTSKQQLTHLLHIDNSNFPLIQNLLANDTYRKMYLAHFKTILLENFDSGSYYDTGLMLKELIDESVQADDNYLFTYNNFLTNLDNDISGGGPGPMGGGTPGIANLMDGRTDYLLSLSDFKETEPTISNISLSDSNPIIGESIWITANIQDANGAMLGYRNEFNAPFTRIQMFDDGAHNDGSSGDGTYGVELTIDNAFMQYYIYADNDVIGKFSPLRAEHEYHSITATTVDTEVGDLVINEFMASNDAAVADQDGEYDDWVELYNNGAEVINLEGYYLSDDGSEQQKWEFPSTASIDPGAYLVVWADNDIDQDGLHASFKLSALSETVFLSDPDGNILDEVSYTEQTADVSYGRFPNGVGDFTTMAATFGAENMIVSDVDNSPGLHFEIEAYPNPAKDYLYLELNGVDEGQFTIYDVNGMKTLSGTISGSLKINTSDWNSGIYFLNCLNRSVKILIL